MNTGRAKVIEYLCCGEIRFRPHFFDLLDYVTRRSEKLRFQKKGGRIWRCSGEKHNYDGC